MGVGGGTLIDGIKGSLLKGWTVTSQLTAGSGLPLTPVYLPAVNAGRDRHDPSRCHGRFDRRRGRRVLLEPIGICRTGARPLGHGGTQLDEGPAQFSLNAGITRTFPWGDRLNLDWRIDATQRSESGDLCWRERARRQPAIRAAESSEYDAEGADHASFEVLSE